MTVIVVSVVLLLVAVPSFKRFIAKQVVSHHGHLLIQALEFTRAEAIGRGLPVTLCRNASVPESPPVCGSPEGDWSGGWIVFVDRDGNGRLNTEDLILREQQPLAMSGLINMPYSSFDRPQAFTAFPNGVFAMADRSQWLVVRPDLPESDQIYAASISRTVCIRPYGGHRLIATADPSALGAEPCAS